MKHEIPNDEEFWKAMADGRAKGYKVVSPPKFEDKSRWSTCYSTVVHHAESDTYWGIFFDAADEASTGDGEHYEPTQVQRVETTQVVISWEPVA